MHFCCRAPYGARGLKLIYCKLTQKYVSRAPYGARGLKCLVLSLLFIMLMSRPVWGAWIEMCEADHPEAGGCVAPRMGRVD